MVITLIFGTIYAAVQQDYRQSANDPQIQIAEDTVASLERGARPQPVPLASQLDISKTLSPFIIIYSATGTPMFATAQLGGKEPTLPEGVLSYTEDHGENRLTWQPQDDVRIAAVIKTSTAGYVLVGRSLREIEKRESELSLQVLLGWLASVIIILLSYFVNHRKPETSIAN